jgi:hypothetical protein
MLLVVLLDKRTLLFLSNGAEEDALLQTSKAASAALILTHFTSHSTDF